MVSAEPKYTGPWDLDVVKQLPEYTLEQTTATLRTVRYVTMPYQGRRTRVFAYLVYPASKPPPYPGLTLVHGGRQRADSGWAAHWADLGYAALAMDLNGEDADGPMPDGGPPATGASVFGYEEGMVYGDSWLYHSVAAVMRGLSVLADQPEVDGARLGVHGISWGGVATCLVAGLDDRVKAAVPVFGGGFLHEDPFYRTAWLAWMSCADRQRWINRFDPSRYLGQARCQMFFLTSPNDVPFSVSGFQRSCLLAGGPALISLDREAGHDGLWTRPWVEYEVQRFLGSVLAGGVPLPQLGKVTRTGRQVNAPVSSRLNITNAVLCYTPALGPWVDRFWLEQPARLDGETVIAELPDVQPLAYYLSVTDSEGASVTTPYVIAGTEGNPGLMRFTRVRKEAGALEIDGAKAYGHQVVLQALDDTCGWRNLATNSARADSFTFTVTLPANAAHGIYRVWDLDW